MPSSIPDSSSPRASSSRHIGAQLATKVRATVYAAGRALERATVHVADVVGVAPPLVRRAAIAIVLLLALMVLLLRK